jgi:TonB-dependent SusC/RagA subfamily outer membrane receptor
MNKFLLACLLLVCTNAAAQNLVESRTSSYYTFIYKITNEEAEKLYTENYSPLNDSLFHTLVDSYPADSVYEKELPTGHYLYIKSRGPTLEAALESVNNLDMAILNNHRDLLLSFHDVNGKAVNTLKPRIGIRNIPFSKKNNAYRIATTNRQGWIKVLHEGHVSFFDVQRKYNNNLPKRVTRRVLGTFPFNHIASPFFYAARSVRSLFDYTSIHPPGIYYRVQKIFTPRPYSGYVVLNKPKYKPGDTVKLKAYIINAKGKPAKHKITLRLNQDYSNSARTKTLAEVAPYRPGAYVYEFILYDSMQLKLDKRCNIFLQSKRTDDYPYASFHYEQYELKQNSFSIRSNNAPPHKPATIFLKGTDANDLPLYDVRVQLIVKSAGVSGFNHPTIFVRDTLWTHNLKLDAIGETSISLPDSIFPKAVLEYKVTAIFTNTDNERHVKELNLKYTYIKPAGDIKIENDSVIFTSEGSGKFKIQALNKDGKIVEQKEISLPYQQKIDQRIQNYVLLQDDSFIKKISLESIGDDLQVSAEHTKDSLLILTQNPRKLPFHYQLFKNNTIIEQGYGYSYTAKRKASPHARYYFAIQYIWAGESRNQNYDIHFAKKRLHIEVDHPAAVYPGQQVAIKVNVTDAFDRPVKNADLTAYSITKKFKEGSSAAVPNFERFKSRKIFNEFSEKVQQRSFSNDLHYRFWKNRLGLDSIEYYHFLYPEKGTYTYSTAGEDSITQIAPFIVSNGILQPIYYIYIDNELKYYHEVKSLEPYSFRASPGRHNLTVRLYNKLVNINHVVAERGKKLILCIDLNNLPKNVEVSEEGLSLSDYEIYKLYAHFLLLNRDLTQRLAYLKQGNNFHAMVPFNWGNDTQSLVGPFVPGTISYHTPQFNTTFDFKPGRSVTIEPKLIDRESYDVRYLLRHPLYYRSFNPSLRDQVQTEKRILEYWKQNELEPQKEYIIRKYPTNYPVSQKTGTLVIQDNRGGLGQHFATFILNLDLPDEYYIFPGHQSSLTPLLPGKYQVVMLYKNGQYSKPKPVAVKPYGRTFYTLTYEKILPADTFSMKVLEQIKKWSNESVYIDQNRMHEMQNLRSLYYRESAYNESFTGGRWVTGKVTDSSGEALPSINIILKGTTNGTITDINGEYRIYVPTNGILVVSFIGYTSQELNTSTANQVNVNLAEDIQMLSEVVVVGYGESQKRSITAAATTVRGRTFGITSLTGRAPGVMMDSISMQLRGVSSIDGNSQPLIVIDGVPKAMDDIDPNRITSMIVFKSEEAVAIYGARAANGVILISTKPGMTKSKLMQTKLPDSPQLALTGDAAPGSSTRKNFRDYAFWQPKLYTDKNGEASFNVTFPDDITGWNIYVLGMASKKRAGQVQSKIQSYKPLAAQLSLPNFLVQGDSAWAIGKITNYGSDSLLIKRSVEVANKIIRQGEIAIKNSAIDTVNLTSTTTDSLSVKYSLTYKKYEDGELRKIPVMPIGSREAFGFFAPLTRDTTLTFTFDSPGKIKLYAQADVMDVLLDEISVLKVYPYDCNEQLASKLKALLAEKAICIYRKEKFNHDKQVEKAIKRLAANQQKDGGWGWWNAAGERSVWITIHIAKALLWADQLGYTVNFDKLGIKNYLMENTTTTTAAELQLKSWIFLSETGEHLAMQSILDSLNKKIKHPSQHEQLLIQRLKQLQKMDVNWNMIDKQRSETLKGNWYWGESNYSLWDNDTDNTLVVFQMMEHRNPNDANLLKLQNYFLEKRKRSWLNTYQSSQIIEVLLPYLLKQKQRERKSAIVINSQEQISKFPYEQEYANVKSISVRKTGNDPVYITAYQEKWNAAPEKVEKDFVIHTAWQQGIKKIKAGKPLKLEVKLEVKKDAEYVMINIPIPAGCSYNSKDRSWSGNEVHREYDLHETRIYCERLRAGIYHYTIDLLPRYKGKYHLNPAKAEWMYFPVIYGREEMKNVVIE